MASFTLNEFQSYISSIKSRTGIPASDLLAELNELAWENQPDQIIPEGTSPEEERKLQREWSALIRKDWWNACVERTEDLLNQLLAADVKPEGYLPVLADLLNNGHYKIKDRAAMVAHATGTEKMLRYLSDQLISGEETFNVLSRLKGLSMTPENWASLSAPEELGQKLAGAFKNIMENSDNELILSSLGILLSTWGQFFAPWTPGLAKQITWFMQTRRRGYDVTEAFMYAVRNNWKYWTAYWDEDQRLDLQEEVMYQLTPEADLSTAWYADEVLPTLKAVAGNHPECLQRIADAEEKIRQMN